MPAKKKATAEETIVVAKSADVIETFADADGQFRWRRKDPANHRILSVPGEGFVQEEHMIQNAKRCNIDVPEENYVQIGVQEEDVAG